MRTQSSVVALLRLGVGLVVIAVVSLLILAFAVGLILALEHVLLGPDLRGGAHGMRLLHSVAGHDETSVAFALVVALLAYTALSAAVLIEARLRGGSSWRDLLAWYPWNIGQTDRRVLILAAAALAYGFLADFALHYFARPPDPWFSMPASRFGALLLTIVAVIAAPVAEELLFRGWIFTDLRRHFGFTTTLAATSAFFAVLHYESTHLYALAVFPIGLALGTMREITGSVKPSIAFHAFNNLLASALAYLGL
jgi:membrane protease YdiL (CAAX protease family)